MPDVEHRLTELEILFTHLQRTVQDLNDVILEQQRDHEQLRGRIQQLQNRLRTLEGGPELRPPGDERPPHY